MNYLIMAKKKTKKEKYVQLCPICGSKDFEFFDENKPANIAGAEMYQCHKCGNVFSFPIEMPQKEAKKISPAKITKKLKENTPSSAYTSVGRVEIGVYWKLLGSVLIIIGLVFLFISTLEVLCHTSSLGELICVANTNPMSFVFMGIANFFAGAYLIFESFVVFRSKHVLSRSMKMLLVLGLLLVIYLIGYPMIFFFP